jgi:transcriptional regulator with XRE-family HTH domain
MSVSPADVRPIVVRVCARPEVLDACARRDLGTVISALGTGGLTQGRIAELTGLSQGRISEWATGKRAPKAVTTFEKFAEGVGLPSAARRALGLDDGSQSTGVTTAHARADVPYPETAEQAVRNVSHLWIADLDDAAFIQRGRADPRAWNEASLRWLVDPGQVARDQSARGVHIGMVDVERFRATVDVFAKLDDKYGGGHARQALIQYLRTDADRMLSGRYTDAVGRELFAAMGEATLLAAWMSYDTAPASALAQGYFVQALALAQAGNDRLLGASVLDAMSHQATFMERFTEAASLARAARAGTSGIATPTLTAHFHAMEARALARLGDAKACGHALSESMREFEQANPENDPKWIQYFNESELSAEFGHCMRDLGRACDAIQHAGNSLATSG